MNAARRSLLCGALFFAGYAALGAAVSHAPPGALDRAGESLIGQGVDPALFFTRLGFLPTYVMICVIALVFGFVRRAWLSRVFFSIGGLVLAWWVSDAGKMFFARPRMDRWIGIHETSYSYASGHATLSLVFYGLWFRFLMRENISRTMRALIAAFMIALIAGIGWSRLVLGAHYLTDVVGGYVLGSALLCAAACFDSYASPAERS